MQLRTARLCLDCEELHTSNECPVCASESYAFLTRWIPVNERRTRNRPPTPTPPPEPAQVSRWMKRGAAGLAVVALSRWIWQATRPDEPQSPIARRNGPGTE
jgi:hypothetical protein